ncbi:YheC/YheD family protein [Paenibacillus sp. y28]|uniref:YheC/YheD family protein n=1 Tax=Paenibacillus sp. y28 TaxID=3129110 RepID=UPI003019AFE9
MKRQYSSSKWKKTKALLKKKSPVARYVPRTERFSPRRLSRMLSRYGMVYIKPEHGSYGIGVMRAIKKKHALARYRLKTNTAAYQFESKRRFKQAVTRSVGKKPYVIQRGIHMLKHRGGPFDLRIMVLLNQKRKWVVPGIVARSAKRGKIVTNGHQGAKSRMPEKLLRPYVGRKNIHRYMRRLRRIGVNTAREFRKTFSRVWELGLDVAVDQRLRPWILEVNMRPEAIPFAKLKDKRMYRRIMALRKLHR